MITPRDISEQDTFEQFKKHFRTQEKPDQLDMIREYVGDIVGDFLEQRSGRNYCESLVQELEFLETRYLKEEAYTQQYVLVEVDV